MTATIIIAAVIIIYSGIMIRRSFKSVKRSLKGEGCDGCSSDCNTCNTIINFDSK